MGHLSRVFSPSVQDGRRVILPHLYFTYLFIGLSSSVVYRLLGREILVSIYGWYYANGLDSVLLGLAVLEVIVRTSVINRSQR